MTTYDLFICGLIAHMQQNIIDGETEKDTIRELFDNQAIIYSDKAAKTVIANVDPQYINIRDRGAISEYAFGDRQHITPKYETKDWGIKFFNKLAEGVEHTLVINPPGENYIKMFNKHRASFLNGAGVLGRNSLLFITP